MIRCSPRLLIASLVIILFTGCNPAHAPGNSELPAEPVETIGGVFTPPVSPTVSLTEPPERTFTAPKTSLLATPTSAARVCSPLHGFQINQLADIVTTVFDPPAPGGEGGHHGVDFAFYSYGAFETMEGLPVQSMLEGTVAAVTDDRPPYGHTVIIETPLSSLPPSWQEHFLSLPQPEEYQPDPRLACPTPAASPPASDQLSLYLLYAHLAEKPPLDVGSQTGCGQQIGLVGNSGFSGNTHLHLEMRLGPSGVQFLHLAHYTANATDEEMVNYCLWRVSPYFRLIDPMEILLREP